MKNPRTTRWTECMAVITLLMLVGCATESFLPAPSRAEYNYEPPAVRKTPTPVPTAMPDAEDSGAVDSQESLEVEEAGGVGEPKKERKGFFSFFSRKSRKEKSPEEREEPATESEETDPEQDAVEAESGDEDEGGLKPGEEIDNVYRLKTGDRLFVTLSGSGGLSEQVETVIDDEGAVKLRYIGAVKAAGRTATELENEIEAEYTDRQKIYKEVVARVVVPNTFYFIGGEVRQPGRFPLIGRVTLSQAIPSAGNFTEWANKGKVILARGDDRFEIDFRKIADDPTRDVELQPGDVITVKRRTFL